MYSKLAALIILAGLWRTGEGRNISKLPNLCVQVLNDAAVESSITRKATEECSRIFKNAGIEIGWTFDSADKTHDFVVVIAKTAPLEASADAVGYIHNDVTGSAAVVFWPRAIALVTYRTWAFEILGRVMAHELGHLILGQPGHSPVGVMRPYWTPNDLRIEKAVSLFFTSRELGQMRANLVRRASSVTAAPVANTSSRDHGAPLKAGIFGGAGSAR